MFRYLLILLLLVPINASARSKTSDIPKSSKELKDALFSQRGIYFSKSKGLDENAYLRVLADIYGTDKDLAIKDGRIEVGDRFYFKAVMQTSPDGPEYINDDLIAIGLDIGIDGTGETDKSIKFLAELPLEKELSSFINKEFLESQELMAEYGKDFYLAALMATMKKYSHLPKVVELSLRAIGKHPDRRLLPFLRDFRAAHDLDADNDARTASIIDFIVRSLIAPVIYGPPPSCSILPDIAKTLSLGTDESEVLDAIRALSLLKCKEAMSYLFFIRHLDYINKGENLFDNDKYFEWDSGNMRFSLDLQQREAYLAPIFKAYSDSVYNSGIGLSQALKILSQRHKIICVGADSVYFDYLFMVPYNADWDLSGRELKSLVNNSLEASSGYYFKKVGNVHRIVKGRT